MRPLKLLLGLFLVGRSGFVFLNDFYAHSEAKLRWIIENRAVGYAIWFIPAAVCCAVCGISGLLL